MQKTRLLLSCEWLTAKAEALCDLSIDHRLSLRLWRSAGCALAATACATLGWCIAQVAQRCRLKAYRS